MAQKKGRKKSPPKARKTSTPSGRPPADGGAIYYVAGEREGGPFSWTWRISSGGTSFYIKAAYERFADVKVSLHGPDPRHNDPHFRLGVDRSATEKVEQLGGVFRSGTDLPLRFPGVEVRPGVRHAVRIRNTWDLFQYPSQSAPVHQTIRSKNRYSLGEPPEPLMAKDLDIYVADRRPYWPRPEAVARENAGLGPLRNKAGQHLTAVVTHQLIYRTPTPERAMQPRTGKPAKNTLRRGFGSCVDETGLLWLVEQMIDTSQPAG
jgi:hypothetical protein